MPKAKQPSRKSKSAWRKNIDLQVVEQGLERKRAAERVGESAVHAGTASSSIFVEDRSGDQGLASVRNGKQKKGLRSLEILNNTTGSSGLTSRARRGLHASSSSGNGVTTTGGLTPEQRAIRAGMSRKDLERLRRVAGRDVKGAFGVVVEGEGPSGRGVEARIDAGSYDVWNDGDGSKGKKKQAAVDDEQGWGSAMQKREIQLPASFLDASKKSRSTALSLPDPGQSYNPAAEAHEALLNRAIEDVQKEEEKRLREMEWKKVWDQGAKEARGKGVDDVEDLVGLKVGQGEVDGEVGDEESEGDSEPEGPVKEAKRKTKQQKAKAKKLKEELRIRAAIKASKRSSSDLQSLRSLKKQLLTMETEAAQVAEKRRESREKRRNERVGVYKLPKRDEEVQLGEDLAEGLRLLKPEGNLLKDRLHGFQKHGIVEPKKRNVVSKRRSKMSMRGKKEYESHAYKRFS